MKVLLVVPTIGRESTINAVPPLGLGYLSTALKSKGIDTEIVDCPNEGLDLNKFLDRIKGLRPDVVGFQTFSSGVYNINKSIKMIKDMDPSVITVVGGAHPSGAMEKTMEHIPNVDFSFIGEAEIGLPMLIETLDGEGGNLKIEHERFRQIPGLVWRENGSVHCNQPVFYDNLDEFGFPSWDLIDPNRYQGGPQGIFYKVMPLAPIIVSRGCPYKCNYCEGPKIAGRKIRRRSIQNVIAEIELLMDRYGVKEIHIIDDNFTADKEYVKEFCRQLMKKKRSFPWCCTNGIRLDCVDYETLRMMKEAGCYSISVGIESGSDKILKFMEKGLTTEKITRQMNLIKKAGFDDITGFIMLGYPGEDEDDILKTIDFMKELPLTNVDISNFMPLPGTRIYDYLVENENYVQPDWSEFCQFKVSYTPKGMSKKKLKSLQRKAYLEFYARPKIVWKLITSIRSFKHLKFILRRIFNYLF